MGKGSEGAGLRAEGVSFAYGARRVLHGVDLTATPGEVLALLGPNGAGKSTLLRLLAGLLAPHAGQVSLDGSSLLKLPRRELARALALVPQDPPPDAGSTVLEAVLLGRAPHLGAWGIEGKDDRERARRALAELGLEAFAGRPVAEL